VREIINEWADKRGITINPETRQRFITYASLIDDANRKFNITGFKTAEEILENLILGSLEPLCDISVPRGTNFVDIGSGAGIPGLALGIFFKGMPGLLIESNQKKADFIRRTANKLGLKTIEIIHDRAENIAGLKNFRESFDWCFSRALASPFITCEIGAAFIKLNGALFIYSNNSGDDLRKEVIKHASDAGLTTLPPAERCSLRIKQQGIIFRKTKTTPSVYPRNYASMKRDAEAIKGGVIEEQADDI
jgi:16S rRNA (guanine527-N7)-methyltransferase